MGNRYVDVTITRQTKAVSEKGFGTPLVLATSKNLPHKVYTEIDQVASDFATTTEEYKLLSRMFGQNPRPAEIAVFGVQYNGANGDPDTLVSALNDLIKTNNDFYYLVSVEQGDDEIAALAQWVSTQEKIYAASTSSETLYTMLNGLYDNVFLLVHDQPRQYPAEGLVALLAPQEIGSYTWTFKTIQGVSPAAYDDTKINDIHEHNACTYIKEGGVNITSHGVATSGEYIDVVQSTHFIKARMTEAVFRLLATNPKIPYTDAGIAMVVAAVDDVLKQAFKQGIIADENGEPLYTITVPQRAEIPANTRAQRVLPDIQWSATIAGAIEKVEIRGTLMI
ncbi:DUF3383 family protein [Geobacillus stearothermophilus]|uniref:DUF3383 family protein n=1 Tax=Geobacillus stearothermophilus TaxID=1422 RepID=A0A150MUP1_GEOSE|nr:DUF3383 family protein [Geobacillus stearothermophilus]KYD28171.1 hypothetical protein B4109_3072 [Geobacillus stearothermophilus]